MNWVLLLLLLLSLFLIQLLVGEKKKKKLNIGKDALGRHRSRFFQRSPHGANDRDPRSSDGRTRLLFFSFRFSSLLFSIFLRTLAHHDGCGGSRWWGWGTGSTPARGKTWGSTC